MKRILIAILLICTASVHAQQIRLHAIGKNAAETTVIDSVSYEKLHGSLKSVTSEINTLTEKLILKGFIAAEIHQSKINDTSYVASYELGPRTSRIRLYLNEATDEIRDIVQLERDTMQVPIGGLGSFMDNVLLRLEQNGYSLAKAKLVNIAVKGNSLSAGIAIDRGNKRIFNDIVVNGYDKFPEGFRRNLRRKYRNKPLTRTALSELSTDLQNIKFITQTRYPEILFLKDTTRIHVYLEKSKPNRFEGYIGFANEESTKINFNGFVDVSLVNLLNSGEEFMLYWKSDGKEQKTFNLALELPYIFKSRFGLKTSLNIFRQDSTFQNTATAIQLGYYFNQKTKAFIGYRSTESSDIQNVDNSSLNDYKNSFITGTFEYRRRNAFSIFFPEQTAVTATAGFGSRTSGDEIRQQWLVELNASHEIPFNNRHSVNIANQTYLLNSDTYLVSELFRFGGIRSIRGFNENSLQGDFLTALLTEYRYTLATNLYVHTITDYGYFTDATSGAGETLLGIGFGFGLRTKNGLLNLVYANGSTDQQQIKLSNSIVHISFKTNF